MYTDRKYEVIGSLGGQRFDAKLETPYGLDQAAFLVSEAISWHGVVHFEKLSTLSNSV